MVPRRQVLLGLAGFAAAFGGCSGRVGGIDGPSVTPPVTNVEFETGDVDVDTTNEPTVETRESDGVVSVAGWGRVGSPNCRELVLGGVNYDRSTDRLSVVVESVRTERSFVDRTLNGCEMSLFVSGYSVTVVFDGGFPDEVTVRERYNGSESVRTFSV